MSFGEWLNQDAEEDRAGRLIIMVGGMFIGAAAGMRISAFTAAVLLGIEYVEYRRSDEISRNSEGGRAGN